MVFGYARISTPQQNMDMQIDALEAFGVEFNNIFQDTTIPQGNLIFNIFASINQMEREVNRERVIVGLRAARKRGKIGGRPKGLSKRLKLIPSHEVEKLIVKHNETLLQL